MRDGQANTDTQMHHVAVPTYMIMIAHDTETARKMGGGALRTHVQSVTHSVCNAYEQLACLHMCG